MDGKGYLLNEPGAQPTSVYGDFSCKEEPDSLGGKKPLREKGGGPQEEGVAWWSGQGAAEVKHRFCSSPGYRQLADWLLFPGPEVCLKMRGVTAMGWTAETAVSMAFRGGGWGGTHFFPPPLTSHNLLHIS